MSASFFCRRYRSLSILRFLFPNQFLLKFWDCSGAKVCKSCRAWQMLSNAYFPAKFRFDTAENEPAKNLQNLWERRLEKASKTDTHGTESAGRQFRLSPLICREKWTDSAFGTHDQAELVKLWTIHFATRNVPMSDFGMHEHRQISFICKRLTTLLPRH